MNRAGARLLAVVALAIAGSPAAAQFGQNKITYDTFHWQVYHAPHFDIHYYQGMEPFVPELVSYAESAYQKISKDLDHELRFRVPMIAYKTHGEFEQTNITLGELGEAVGGFSEPAQNRIVVPIDLPPDKLYQLIAHETVHIFQYSLFFEGYLGRALRSNPPAWLIEGMASYFGDDEDNLDRMAIRDAVINDVLPSVAQLSQVTFLTYRFGHALFDFIEHEHGKEGLRNFIFEYRKVLLSNNIEKAVKEAFGYELGEFDRRFNRYLRQKYFPILLEKKEPDDYGKEIGIKRPGVFTFPPAISPSGELVAALATPTGLELDLLVFSADQGKVVRNVTKGWTNEYRNLVTKAFEAKRDLSWSPVGDRVALFARRENRWPLLVYDPVRGRKVHEVVLKDIVQCASPAFSPDGQRVAFEGNRDGVVDIFEVDLATKTVRNLTADADFDANPWYAADGRTLVYNRRIGSNWKVFFVDLNDPQKKTQLTFGPWSDVQPSYSRDGKTLYFSSDRGLYGIFNIHALDLATGETRQYTDVTGGCFAPVEMAEREGETYLAFSAYFSGTFRLYRMPLRQPEVPPESERLQEPAEGQAPEEAAPFEPPLTLTVDETAHEPYRLRWDLEAPSVLVGVTDDGTFLSNVNLQFADLMGDHRIQVLASSVSDFVNFNVLYQNRKRRMPWGGYVYDYRDYFLSVDSAGFLDRDLAYQDTGAAAFAHYPINRYYRLEGSVGAATRQQDYFTGFVTSGPSTGIPLFDSSKDRFATVSLGLTGDTVRYERFGPLQGKRFIARIEWNPQISGDGAGDIKEYQLDFRAYKQATRRSLLAWRLGAIYNNGDAETLYGFGGLNQLRGFEFRDFFGSRMIWSNLEFRFPLIDELRFPVLPIYDIRGFFFIDAGAAWMQDDIWYDPEFVRVDGQEGGIRVDPQTGDDIPFDFWDSDEGRLGDGRGSYGTGLQFLFIGGLQFNWVWSWRMDYTQVACGLLGECTEFEADTGGVRTDFYIFYDW